MKKLKLIVSYKCNRKCEGCCNTQSKYGEHNVPVINQAEAIIKASFMNQIIITGGEPLMFPEKLMYFIQKLNDWTFADIIVYSAMIDYSLFVELSKWIMGFTISLHLPIDVVMFNEMHQKLIQNNIYDQIIRNDNRLNIFPGMKENLDPSVKLYWKIKEIEMLEDCPLPEDEVLYQLGPQW